MKLFNNSKARFLRKIFQMFGVSALGLACQACYGAPSVRELPVVDVKISGTVKSKTATTPINGIKVSYDNTSATTDIEGKFVMTINGLYSGYDISLEDIDGAENREYSKTNHSVENPDYNESIDIGIIEMESK